MNKKPTATKRNLLFSMLLLSQLTVFAAETDISNMPIDALDAVKPNIIFALDDSGSMDSEVLLETNDGAFWYDGSAKSFADSSGKLHFNASGSTGSNSGNVWYKYVYLFPNGTGTERRQYGDSNYDHYAIPPTPEFAFMRSAEFNPLYYNPLITYKAWNSAYIDGSMKTFSDATKNNAASHPVFSGHTLDLTQVIFSTSSNHTFRMQAGMTVPGGSIAGIEYKNGRKWDNVTQNLVVPNNASWDVAIPYYPASYYVLDASCTTGPTCAQAPDGRWLRLVEVKPGNTFPSGRTYDAELQNFANWYTFYRKRKLMMSAAMGQVLHQINQVRGGLVQFNNRQNVTMYDFDDNDPAQNNLNLLGRIYKNPASGGTPTRTVLQYVGDQFKNNNQVVQKACQFNAAMVLTDGFATTTGPTPPAYNSAIWGNGTPYQTSFPNSLADIALSYYSNNIRPDLPSGKVPLNPDDTSPAADKNPNLHMNTYGLTIGLVGTIYGTGSPEHLDPYTNPPVWPNPNVERSQAAIDDLWHATVNGRGKMTDASNPVDLVAAIREIMYDVLSKAHASSAVGVADVYMDTNNNAIYAASHHVGYGELKKYMLDLSNGHIQSSSFVWAANTHLDTVAPSARKIATYDGSTGIPFQFSSLPAAMQKLLDHNLSNNISGTMTSAESLLAEQNLNWIRGDQTLPSETHRSRTHLLGSIVNASPVVVGKARKNYADSGYAAFKIAMESRNETVYQAANDGMLHAFDTATGEERWAYVPKVTFEKLEKIAAPDFVHEFSVDATPAVADVFINNQWKTILVGGHGAGGAGYYALDITTPDAATEADVVAKVLWEYPNAQTPIGFDKKIGLSYGTPKIIKTAAAGWVVLIPSGYNNTETTGQGYVFVIDPSTGALLKTLSTGAGSPTTPSGLAHIAVYSENSQFDPMASTAYGGDLLGNLWRFDFSGDSINDWNVSKLATLVDASGTPQPITTEPELAQFGSKRMIYVGTGKLLGQSDVTSTAPQTIYGIADDSSATPLINPLRSNLLSVGSTLHTGDRGWYYDLESAGERISNMPVLALDQLVLNANKPSDDGCSSESYQYVLSLHTDAALYAYHKQQNTGTDPNEPPPAAEPTLPEPTVTRKYNGNSLASNPSLVVLPDDTVVAISHNSDDTFSTVEVATPTASAPPSAVAWREVLRD